MTKTRRAHLTRDPAARVPPLDQIDQGVAILRLLDRLGWLVNDQIESLLFRDGRSPTGKSRTLKSAEHACNRALRQLFDGGFLDRVPLFLIPPMVASPREGWVHVPTAHTADVLRALGEEPIWREQHAPRPYQRFEHALLVSWFGFICYRDCRPAPWQCWNYLADRHLAAARIDGARYAMIPDGHFIISNLQTGHTFTHFFEIDRGFTSGSGQGSRYDWVAKIRDYATYLGPGGGWSQDFGSLPRPVVLIVTTSARRAETILGAVAEAQGGGAYWVATFDEVATDGLWGAIWRVVGEATRRSLEQRCRS